MSQTKLYIFLFFIVFGLTNQAQTTDELDIGELEISLQQQLDQAKLLTTRGDYYNAKDNLEKALDIATKINDRKSEGVIYTKIAKLQYLIEEPDQAISSLTKAISIQRDINDKTNLGLTYNIRGVIHSNLKQYKTALEYYSNALNSLKVKALKNMKPKLT